MTDRELMQQALDALEHAQSTEPIWKMPIREAKEALRARLAQPEPEQTTRHYCREIYEVWAGSEGIPMPQTAPEAYLLHLVEQMRDIAKEGLHKQPEPEPVAWLYDFYNPDDSTEIIKDWVAYSLSEVERCKGVNVRPLYTAQPQCEWKLLTDGEQKPEAKVIHYIDPHKKNFVGKIKAFCLPDYQPKPHWQEVEEQMLYTAPPQREWQWLTDEERMECFNAEWNDQMQYAQVVEAKSKEKNA